MLPVAVGAVKLNANEEMAPLATEATLPKLMPRVLVV